MVCTEFMHDLISVTTFALFYFKLFLIIAKSYYYFISDLEIRETLSF